MSVSFQLLPYSGVPRTIHYDLFTEIFCLMPFMTQQVVKPRSLALQHFTMAKVLKAVDQYGEAIMKLDKRLFSNGSP